MASGENQRATPLTTQFPAKKKGPKDNRHYFLYQTQYLRQRETRLRAQEEQI